MLEKKEKVDIKENKILKIDSSLLEILLKDKTTGKNIMWLTEDYEKNGIGYKYEDEIRINAITGRNGEIIKPRVEKTKQEQQLRVKEKAEVFTPLWICNKQNNLIDSNWFGRENVFNTEKGKKWTTNKKKIEFDNEKTWEQYIKDTRLEIACGEAPYLVSRYDTISGKSIKIENRIGLLDRKLRILNENVDEKKEWMKWCKKAYQNIYGFDWQGDNVLLARENLLYTFKDYYKYKFKEMPSIELQREIAEIISWNIWQMDGLKGVVPNSCENDEDPQINLFEKTEKKECKGCKNGNIKSHNGKYCKIRNWEKGKTLKYITLMKKEREK